MADHASGFCVYNDAALAIKALLDAGVDRVAYVDIDVHHGDGVQAAFYDDPRVLTVSIHETPLTLWPGTGCPDRVRPRAGRGHRGESAGPGRHRGRRPGCGRSTPWCPSVVTAFRPQVLVTQHGADTHRDDPLADLNLTVDGQLAAYRALRDLAGSAAGGRWLALGGGGYSLVRVVPQGLDPPAGHGARPRRRPREHDPGGLDRGGRRRPSGIAPPIDMTDGVPATAPVFDRWDGNTEVAGRPLDHRGAAGGVPGVRARPLRPA